MNKSEIFKVQLVHKNYLYIPVKFAANIINDQKRVQLKLTHKENSITFYAALRKDKNSGQYRLMFSKAKQQELNLTLGDEFEAQLFKDTSKYGVEMPEELDAVLMSDYDAYQIFENLTKGKQRSIIYYILRLKNSQKRIDQSLLLCENLKRGNTQNKELFQPI